MTLTPAFGRDYKNQAAVKRDWLDGKLFVINDFGPDMGRTANCNDLIGVTRRVVVRYARMTKVMTLDVPREPVECK